MADRIALQGFSSVKFFAVVENSATAYAVGEGFDVPWAQEMTKEVDASESKIYADDMLYMNVKSWNGIKATITLAEMPLEMFESLGFGTYDAGTRTLKYDPEGQNTEFAVSFRCKRADGQYRMFRMFSFVVNEIKEASVKTKGAGTEIAAYQLIGTFTKRKLDGVPYEAHDGDDLDWLDMMGITAE